MSIWKEIYKNIHWNMEQYELAVDLVHNWKQEGYVHKTCLEMLELEDEVIILFYNILEETQSFHSPVANYPNSSWMLDSDFCFINVRATGIHKEYGDFLQASKLLPVIRAQSIHLGPFTSYDFGTIYAITSTKTISKNVVNTFLWEKGICPDKQLSAFVQAAHMLEKCVGFDLEPHVSQFAKTVLEHPQYFRWIVLDDNRLIRDGLSQEEQLSKPNQEQIHKEINDLITSRLKKEALTTIESETGDTLATYDKKEQVYFDLIGEVIKKGYWTVPSHTWNGIGVPAYDGYNEEGNFANFLYLDQYGNNQNDTAYNVLTPFQYFHNLKVNQITKDTSTLELNEKAFDYYSNIFVYWRDHFNFDFVRHDSHDHIFDSIDGSGNPLSDRITPTLLTSCNATSRSKRHPYIGNLAERMGYDYAQYYNVGFDLLLGNEALESISSDFINRQFYINKELAQYNKDTPKASCVFATDTHDTGNPHMWGKPLIELAGIDGMRLRQFVARFMPVGSSYRPKYEVMGSQDQSFGLFNSNISNENLTWLGNKYFNKIYHYIEDVFKSVQSTMGYGNTVALHNDWNYCWWVIRHHNQVLIPVISTENGSGSDHFTIYLKGMVDHIEKIEVHDFYKGEKFSANDSFDEINIYNLQYRQCLLYQIQIKL